MCDACGCGDGPTRVTIRTGEGEAGPEAASNA